MHDQDSAIQDNDNEHITHSINKILVLIDFKKWEEHYHYLSRNQHQYPFKHPGKFLFMCQCHKNGEDRLKMEHNIILKVYKLSWWIGWIGYDLVMSAQKLEPDNWKINKYLLIWAHICSLRSEIVYSVYSSSVAGFLGSPFKIMKKTIFGLLVFLNKFESRCMQFEPSFCKTCISLFHTEKSNLKYYYGSFATQL